MSLAEILQQAPEELLIPNKKLKSNALDKVKLYIDPIAKEYSIFDEIHVDGLDADQVWGQVQMVIDGTIENLLDKQISPLLKNGIISSEANADISEDEEVSGLSDEGSEGGELDQSIEAYHEEEDEEDESGELDLDNFQDDFEESDVEIEEEFHSIDEGEDEDENVQEEAEEYNGKASELDDEIFKLKDFQKQVLDLEKEDDNEEFIDFGASHLGEEEGEDEDDDADAKYADFFAPPKRQRRVSANRSNKNVRFNESANEEREISDEDEETNIEKMMASSKKDLFEDEEEDSGSDEEGENLSTFQKQQKEIMKQIQQLELENVGQKKWEVRGEVKANDRPRDSLIESELDFERNVKAAPIITDEVTGTLEDMIRKRIKEGNFDDLPRRLPDLLPEFAPSRRVEVQETKSTKSLAELYEEDYAKEKDPSAYKDAETEKLDASHKEIEELFNSLNHKLDALSSWSYTPKRAKPTISIVTEAAAISMEEAQPTALATESMLAPQEVYTASTNGKREVIGRDGVAVAKREMDKDERKRERRRQKTKRAKHLKARDELQRSKAQKEGSRANVLETLKKGNVTIIGKQGEKRDIGGKLRREAPKQVSSNLKL